MPVPKLEEFEVALIKTMLKRGMKNKDIQFYFNRPSRSVNSGRITEIAKRHRWKDIAPASDHELDEFIENHPMANEFRPTGEPKMPKQLDSAGLFYTNAEGLIDCADEALQNQTEVREAYSELRGKVQSLIGEGHNVLGDAFPMMKALHDVLPDELRDASVLRIWSKGNSLRAKLNAHDAVVPMDDFHPDKLDKALAERLRDLIHTFNVFAIVEPNIQRLDQAKLGPDQKDGFEAALKQARPLLEKAEDIATERAREQTLELISDAERTFDNSDGDRHLDVSANTAGNFFTAVIVGAYRKIRAVIGDGVSSVWSAVKEDLAGKVWEKIKEHTVALIIGGGVSGTAIFPYLKTGYEEITGLLTSIQANPVIQQLLEFVVSLF